MKQCDFTYSWYEQLIDKIVANGYTISNYHNYQKTLKPCILRHDVDMSVEKAVELAALESDIGVQATYFFLISSEFYNILAKRNLDDINKILSVGHEIGLHFDETKYPINGDVNKFIEYVEEELFILERILGIDVNVVSMLRPSIFTLENDIKFSKAVNSYSKEFFNNFKYLSDSRMNWREDVVSVVESQEFNKLHILTHPFWYSTEVESTSDKIRKFISLAGKERYQSIADNFRNVEEFVRMEEIN